MGNDQLLIDIKDSIDNNTTSIDDLTDAYASYQDLYSDVRLPADSASDTWEKAIFKAPFNCTVTEVIVVPDGDIGQATNYMTLDVQDKGADGAGTTSKGSLAVNSTNTIEGMVGVDMISTDAAVLEGRVLSLKKTVAASGQAFPGGLVRVKYQKS